MKKLITSTEALRPALKKLAQAVSAKPTVPILSNLYLQAREGEMELITCDLELTISCLLPCECKQPFEMLVPFDFLSKLIGLLGNEPLEIEYHSSTKAIVIAEGQKYEMGGLEKVKDYPNVPEVPVKNTMELDEEFMEWLHRSMATVSTDDLKPAMTQACLELDKTGITIASTNAHCLFRRFFPKPFEGNAECILISPRIAKAMKGVDKAMLSWRQNHVALTADKVKVIATRLDAKFPDYRVVIPDSKPTLRLHRQDLLGALYKSSLFNQRQVSLHFPEGENNRFTVHTEDADMARVSDVTVAGAYEGNTREIAFEPKLFETVLDQVPFDDIRLHIDGPIRGVVITSEEEPNYLGLIMPLMLNTK